MSSWKLWKLVLLINIKVMESVNFNKWGRLSFGILTITSLLTVKTLQNEIQGNVVWKECSVMLREFRIVSHVSFAECANACNARSKCTSVQYQQRYNICQLLTTDVTDDVNDHFENGKWHGTCAYVAIHHENDSNVQPGSFSCDNCSRDEVCDKQQEVCSFQECAGLCVSNATLLGNQNHVGAIRKIVCEPGTIEVNNEQFVRCDSSGQWNYTPRCLPNTPVALTGLPINCPNRSWEWFSANENPAFTLALVKTSLTFSEAQAQCNAQNSTVVRINEKWKQDRVYNYIHKCNGFQQHYLIDGVKSPDGTEWRFGDNTTLPNFILWLDGDSGASGDGKNCIRFRSEGVWQTHDCGNKENFICEKHISAS